MSGLIPRRTTLSWKITTSGRLASAMFPAYTGALHTPKSRLVSRAVAGFYTNLTGGPETLSRRQISKLQLPRAGNTVVRAS
jgi:hypothetical protein